MSYRRELTQAIKANRSPEHDASFGKAPDKPNDTGITITHKETLKTRAALLLETEGGPAQVDEKLSKINTAIMSIMGWEFSDAIPHGHYTSHTISSMLKDPVAQLMASRESLDSGNGRDRPTDPNGQANGNGSSPAQGDDYSPLSGHGSGDKLSNSGDFESHRDASTQTDLQQQCNNTKSSPIRYLLPSLVEDLKKLSGQEEHSAALALCAWAQPR